jgi:hypothetical protein
MRGGGCVLPDLGPTWPRTTSAYRLLPAPAGGRQSLSGSVLACTALRQGNVGSDVVTLPGTQGKRNVPSYPAERLTPKQQLPSVLGNEWNPLPPYQGNVG